MNEANQKEDRVEFEQFIETKGRRYSFLSQQNLTNKKEIALEDIEEDESEEFYHANQTPLNQLKGPRT